MLNDFTEKMGTKKLLNTSSSPPIAYKRYSDNSEEQKPLQQQQLQQHCHQQHTGNSNKSKSHNNNNNNTNTTCLLVKQNTNTMFTKLRNYFTQLRTPSAPALTTSQKHFSQPQQQRKRHQRHHYRHERLTECNSIPIVQSTGSMLSFVSIVVTLVFLASFSGVTANPVFVDNPSLAQFQSGRNIRHLPCIVRKSGRSGVCMFAIDCIKKNGTHLGTCIDRFYFGSCCDIKEEELTEIADNSIDQNTISHHFTPESSTLPTSALFKLTTLSPIHQHSNISITSSSTSSSSSSSSSLTTQQDVTQMLNSVTQTFASTTLNETPRPTTLVTSPNTAKPNKPSTTTKPSQQTTHKQSHFVIRTTAKPTKYTPGAKPSHNTTTKKKTTLSTTTKKATTTTTTSTTTKRPILTTTETTQQRDEFPAEVTTSPTKLFTYQIVETTTYTPTEVTNMFDFVTTERIQHKTTNASQTTSSSSTTTTPTKATTTKQKETTTSTTATPTQKITTIKLTTQTTRKSTTTKKPTNIKRTTVKPTRRPTTTTSTTAAATISTNFKTHNNNTTATQTFASSTASQTTITTLGTNKTTLAPRPRPKPTASIIKVPRPTTTTTKATTKTPTTSTTTTTQKTTEELENSSSTITTSTATTKKPTKTTPATTTTTATTTSTTPKTTATTTQKLTQRPVLSSTTHKPGLVTWTNIDGEPVDKNQPINSDWVPVTSEAPLNTQNKLEEPSSANATIEEMDISVSSSVSAVMNNTTVIISPPQEPVLMAKPTSSSTTSSTTTTQSSFEPTTTTHKPTATTSEPETTTSAQSSSQITTEGFSQSTTTTPTGYTTEELTTENLNFNSTTTSPISGLEGVDYRQVCGRRMFPEPRIVGGSNAAFGRWPWQISLRQWRTSTYLHKCGAALLNENWAITAAHCVDNVPPSDLLLRLGEYDLAEEEEPYGYQERRVQIVASHPQFDPRTFEYDLALLRFYEPVVFQPNIIPVCVPESDEDFIGQTAFVTGWGRLYEDGPLPSVLQEVAVPVINNTICESMYRAAGYIEHIPHIFICAGWKKGGYDSCEGDSGGPMVLQRESDKRFQLGGVISWGIGCAEANQPGVYTRISEFRDWINQILQF